jgi:hypothetical protein
LKVIYTPEGADPREWDFDPGKMHDVEAIEIEKRTGLTYAEFGERFLKGSILAKKALLFVLMRRSIPTLKWDELQFTVEEVNVEFDADEKTKMVDALQKKASDEGLEPEEKQVLDSFLAEGVQPSPAEDGSVPKA